MSHELGWNSHFEESFASFRAQGLEPGRVAREDRGRYRVLGPAAEWTAELTGRFRHAARSRSDLPAVGDWVAIQAAPGSDQATIHAVVPRTSAFVRRAAGEVTEEQVVAANVDTVFVVTGLDGDFNVRRIERYLTAAWESGALPVIVLNKADLATELDERMAEVTAAAPGVAVVALSARDGTGLEAISPWLVPGHTVALIGSSGVGKSTLVNALLGDEAQSTAEVRAHDSRGRHTTTRRELIALPSGALLVDTPGMRELQLWSEEESLAGAFSDVDACAAQCRFGDCGHDTEPGCAVKAAMASGALDAERVASWRKLQRELRWLARQRDRRARAQELARWKAITRSMRQHPKAGRQR